MSKDPSSINWFKGHRSLLSSQLWLSEPFTKGQAWVDLFGNANWEDKYFIVRGVKVVVKRGQCGFSEITMAKRWKWSRGKVRRFLNELEHDLKIVQHKNNLTSLTTICNYEKYQSDSTTDSTADGTTDGTQLRIYKKERIIRKEEEIHKKAFEMPTIEQIREYCKERKNSVDPELFFNYYETRGWKLKGVPMKSWKAAVGTWERYDKEKDNAKNPNRPTWNSGIYGNNFKRG